MSSWSGKTLGNVVIKEMIARGGMAEVYNGTHTTLQRNVAVKIMRDHVEEDPDSRARFDREARVVAGLDHPNIIKIFDYTLVDGRPCLIMELVLGNSLGNYLKALQTRGERLPFETIASLLTAIASAMDYAHERGIIHRDIKPANILLRSKSGGFNPGEPLPPDVEPVLTDFGLVRLLDASIQTSTGTVFGTPSYMSPEQARGDRVTHQTDIYSLGVMLYEMLAGAVPFDAESSFGVLMKHLNEPPPPIAGISTELQSVIHCALAKDPANRYDAAGEFIREFISVHNGGRVSGKTKKLQEIPKPAEAQTAAVSPPSRVPAYIGGAILLALAAFAAVWIMRPRANLRPPLDRDQPVGYVTFADFNYLMDKAEITVTGLPPPKTGNHYEAWLLSSDGETRRKIGALIFEGKTGELTFTDREGINLLSAYDQFKVTLEPNDGSQSEPGSEVAASSTFPPLALVHVRHLIVAMGSTPDGTALIHGLWNTAYDIDVSTTELDDAFAEGAKETLRSINEEIINQLAGNQNPGLYKDWNGDGEIEDPALGFGFLQNGDPARGTEQGYLNLTLSHAGFAAGAADATQGIVENRDRLAVCIQNMQGWSGRLLELALRLEETPIDQGMESIIAEMRTLSTQTLYGEDANNNGLIEAVPGECGAGTAYEFAYRMAEMPLLPGANRMPPPVNEQKP